MFFKTSINLNLMYNNNKKLLTLSNLTSCKWFQVKWVESLLDPYRVALEPFTRVVGYSTLPLYKYEGGVEREQEEGDTYE